MPQPPEDIGGVIHVGFDSFSAFAVAMIVLMVIGMVWLVVWSNNDDAKRQQFYSKCIEWHTLERCKTLYDYGRTDLGLKP